MNASRNLVVCIDGTSNKFGRKNTNVVKLFKQIELGLPKDSAPQQYAYYSSGIGTHAKKLPFRLWVEKIISDKLEQALAWNIEENVKDAYGWLAGKYRDGDKIYLFGFSRGAYQVRVLACLIHEVGLIRTPTAKQIEMAYGHYLSINPQKPATREMATEFKKTYCWPGLRVHFVGVWDTVSSIGLIRGDVFVSTSASIINASHFRHALALDECRVKFMPEYFQEMNACHNNILRPDIDSDIKEVWFAGCHSDVGGVGRPGHPYHAGNVPLWWMQSEAADQGLILRPGGIIWNFEDIRSGRINSMTWLWRLYEIMPVHHQISFSGTGRNRLRLHLSRARRIIPGQHIHYSVWCEDMYKPRAILGSHIAIPVMQEQYSQPTLHDGSQPSLKAFLAWIQQYAADHTLSDLLKFRLDNPSVDIPDRHVWQYCVATRHGFGKVVAITALVSTLNIATNIEDLTQSDGLIAEAKQCLQFLLDMKHPDFVRSLYLLPFLKTDRQLQRVISDTVIPALIRALISTRLERPQGKDALPLVVESVCLLMQVDEMKEDMLNWLTNAAESVSGPDGLTILSSMLNANDARLSIPSLRIITHLARARREVCQIYMKKIRELATREKGLVGLMAVAVFDILREPSDGGCGLNFDNVLAYLGSNLWLDVEGGECVTLKSCHDPVPLGISGSDQIDMNITEKIIVAMRSRNMHARTTATLTFLKLCRYPGVRKSLLKRTVLEHLIRQLPHKESTVTAVKRVFGQKSRKKTSLLAAYALKTCLANDLWESDCDTLTVDDILKRVTPSIVTMLRKGWFDDSVGLVEGFDIFGDLVMMQGTSKQTGEHLRHGIVEILKSRLAEVRGPDATRMIQRCLHILENGEKIAVEPRHPDSAVPPGPVVTILQNPSSLAITDPTGLLKLHLMETPTSDQPVVPDPSTSTNPSGLPSTAHSQTNGMETPILDPPATDVPASPELRGRPTSDSHLTEPPPPVLNPSITSDSLRDRPISVLTEPADLGVVFPNPDLAGPPHLRAMMSSTSVSSAVPSADTTRKLVEDCLHGLRVKPWKIQKRVVKTLFVLSQTVTGEDIICSKVSEIAAILLPEPEGYWDTRDSSLALGPPQHTLPSQMLGPASALYTLSLNPSVRMQIRGTEQYAVLKGRYFSGSLVHGRDTPLWKVNTPNKSDVLVMVDKVIKAVDEGLSHDGIGSVPEMVPVDVRHWSGPAVLLRNNVVRIAQLLPRLATAVARKANKFRRATGEVSPQEQDLPRVSHSGILAPADPGISDSGENQGASNSNQDSDAHPAEGSPVCTTPQDLPLSDSNIRLGSENEPGIANAPTTHRVPEGVAQGHMGESHLVRSPILENANDQPPDEQAATRTTNDPAAHSRRSIAEGPTPSASPNPTPIPLEQRSASIVEEPREPHLHAPNRFSGPIKLEGFTALDLPKKKLLGFLSPRVRVRVRVGQETFVSPMVKIGNEPAHGRKSRTHWEWPLSLNGDPEIIIERRFLFGYSRIRQATPTTVQSIKTGHTDKEYNVPLKA